ncbi:MAG: hypothetical protein RMY00_33390 [Nostoc sp. ChiVER01]|nr:hypothetical protein [Nostoc sp. ChiVER01]
MSAMTLQPDKSLKAWLVTAKRSLLRLGAKCFTVRAFASMPS